MKSFLIVFMILLLVGVIGFIIYIVMEEQNKEKETDLIVYSGCNYTGKKAYVEMDKDYFMTELGMDTVRSAKCPADVYYTPMSAIGTRHLQGGIACDNYSIEDKPAAIMFSKEWITANSQLPIVIKECRAGYPLNIGLEGCNYSDYNPFTKKCCPKHTPVSQGDLIRLYSTKCDDYENQTYCAGVKEPTGTAGQFDDGKPLNWD